MPFEKARPNLNVTLPDNQLPEEQQKLGYTDVIGDAFHIDNPVVALFKDKDKEVSETDFDVVGRMEEDGIPINLLEDFLYVDNENEYRTTLSGVQRDLNSRERLASAGIPGILASMTAASASPSILAAMFTPSPNTSFFSKTTSPR